MTNPREHQTFFILCNFCQVMLYLWSEPTHLNITVLDNWLLHVQKMWGTFLGLCGSVWWQLHMRKVKCGGFNMIIAVSINIFIVVPPVLSNLKKKIVHKQNNSVIDHLNGVSKHTWLIDWLICSWVQDLTVLMHLGLNWQALCAPYQVMGALLIY